MRRKLFVQLGRFGDIINVLPILQEENRLGNRPVLMVAKDYASIMDGVPYADVLVYDGAFEYLLPALRQANRYAHAHDMDVVTTQVYGLGYKWDRKTDSFATDAWYRAAYMAAWNRLPLTFARDMDREERLARRLPERPILLATSGRSSPFPHAERLTKALKTAYPGRVVVLDDVKAERIYDVLGLYDRAAVLVTIDTMHAHLCMGSKVPTVCLVVQTPTTWHGAPERPNHVLRVKYPEYVTREKELLATVAQYAGEPAAPKAPRSGRLLHVYANYPASGDTLRRHDFARDTWEGFTDHPFEQGNGYRTAEDVLAYPRPLPFLRDLIAYGMGEANPSDIIVVTNTDTAFAPGLASAIRKHVRKHGAAYAHRHDFARLTHPMDARTIRTGKWYPGSDLFAFTPQWWASRSVSELPDMLVGAEFVDCVFRQFIKKHGGVELVGAIYHERHASAWERPGMREVDAANCWNRKLAREWFASNGTTDRDPWDAPLPDARKFAV